MPIEKVIFQIIIILVISEEFFRKSSGFNFAYEHTYTLFSKVLNWRANANNLRELINIPKLSIQVSAVSLLIFFLLSFIMTPSYEMLLILFGIFIGGVLLNSLFEWVFNHKETIKVFVPVLKMYILLIILLILNFLLNTDYPKDIEIFKLNSIHIPSKMDIIEKLLIVGTGFLIFSYFAIWVFSLSVIFIILIILAFTTFLSKFIKSYLGRGGLGIIILLTQLWVLW